jgi:hypothetical protein
MAAHPAVRIDARYCRLAALCVVAAWSLVEIVDPAKARKREQQLARLEAAFIRVDALWTAAFN